MVCDDNSHVPSRGWAGGIPYFRILPITVDGIGHQHALLEATCKKCGCKYTVGAIHLPKEPAPARRE